MTIQTCQQQYYHRLTSYKEDFDDDQSNLQTALSLPSHQLQGELWWWPFKLANNTIKIVSPATRRTLTMVNQTCKQHYHYRLTSYKENFDKDQSNLTTTLLKLSHQLRGELWRWPFKLANTDTNAITITVTITYFCPSQNNHKYIYNHSNLLPLFFFLWSPLNHHQHHWQPFLPHFNHHHPHDADHLYHHHQHNAHHLYLAPLLTYLWRGEGALGDAVTAVEHRVAKEARAAVRNLVSQISKHGSCSVNDPNHMLTWWAQE